MNRFAFTGLLLLATCLGWSRHPFYQQLHTDGKNAMATENWADAARFLEIAAFGMMGEQDALKDIYVRLVVVHHKLENRDAEFKFRSRAERVLGANPQRPASLSVAFWNEYQVLIGAKAPPVPSGVPNLQGYVRDYPDQVRGWVALVDAQQDARDEEAALDAALRGLTAHPQNAELLRRALQLDVVQNNGRNAGDYAADLLQRNADDPLANEYMGLQAAEANRWDEAQSHFAKVRRPQLEGTGQAMNDVAEAIKERQEAADRAEERRKAQADQAERDRKAREAEDAAQAAREQRRRDADQARERQRLEDEAKKQAEDEAKRIAAAEKAKQEQADRDERRRARQAQQNRDEPEPSTTSGRAATPEPEPEPDARQVRKDRIRELTRVLRGNPQDKIGLQFELFGLYLEDGNQNRARSVLNDLGRSKQGIEDTRYMGAFARYNFQRNRFGQVVEDLGKIRELTPEARYYLGMSYYRLNRFDQAKEVLTGLDRGDWPRLEAVDRRISQELEKETKDRAREARKVETQRLQRKVDAKQATPAEAAVLLADLAAVNDWRSVRRVLNDTGFRGPDFTFYRARLDLEEGDFDNALRTFSNLINANYFENEIYYFAGLAAMRKGDANTARTMFQKALGENSRYRDQIEGYLSDLRL